MKNPKFTFFKSFKKPHFGLLVKICFTLVIIISAIIGMFGELQYEFTAARVKKDLKETSGLIADRLAVSLPLQLMDTNRVVLRDTLLAELQDPKVIGIVVWEPSHRKAIYGMAVDMNGVIRISYSGPADENAVKAERTIFYKPPGEGTTATRLGTVETFVSSSGMKAQLRDVLLGIVAQGLVLDFIIVFIIVMIFRTRLIRPLTKIVQTMQKIQQLQSGNQQESKNNTGTTPPALTLEAALGSISKDSLQDLIQEKSLAFEEIKILGQRFYQMIEAIIAGQKKLQESEELFRQISSSAYDAIVMVSDNGSISFWNTAAEKIFGLSATEASGKNFSALIATGIAFSANGTPSNSLSTHGAGQTTEVEALRKDGSHFYGEASLASAVVKDRLYTIVILRDVTEKKKAADELLQTKKYLANVIDSMPSLLVGMDPQGRITEFNIQAEKKTGLNRHEARGRRFVEVFPTLANQIDKVMTALRERKPQKIEKFSTQKDGETVYSDVMIYPLVADGVDGAVIRLDDVTMRVRLEKMMVQTEKMMSVGGLAAGMAHEINNPLGAILQGSQNILRRISPELPKNVEVASECKIDISNLQEYLRKREIITFLEGIQDAGKRAAAIIENMLQFSRRSDSKLVASDLKMALDRTVQLACSDYDLKKKYDFRRIEITREYADDVPLVPCVISEIEQVLLNLMRNAAQAMAGNPGQQQPERITLRLRRENSMVRIEVEDNGPGMSDAVMKHLFEPFFTTKEVGVGTGLGLSVSYFIITDSHKGMMWGESAPGKGAKFIIQLPVEVKAT